LSRRPTLSRIAAVLLGLCGLALFIPASLPYPKLKSLLDTLTSDGNFNSLKPWNASVFHLLFGAAGLFLFSLAGLTSFRQWGKIGSFFKQLGTDARVSFSSMRLQINEAGSLALLLVLTALAVIYRLEYVVSPLHHDEAYTYVAFGRSLFSAIGDYHLPNNHVFHSILVYFSTQIFGNAPWAVRLPAFAAGVLLVPAVYWLGRRFYDRWTALGAAFLVAWSPALIEYATNARGYTLVALFTALTLGLGEVVRRSRNYFAWGLIVLFSALGLYTVPVMLFPFGVLFTWLILEYLFKDIAVSPGTYRSRREFLYCWLGAGFGTALLTLLLYLPILVYTGPGKLFANGFVTPLPWGDLLETLAHRFAETWAEWTLRVPLALILLLGAGWVLGLIFHRRLSGARVPLHLAALAWIATLLLIQRPNAWSKVWVFLLPLMFLWAAAGIFGLLRKVHFGPGGKFSLAAIAFAAVLLVGIWHGLWLIPQFPELWAIKGEEEKAVLYIQEQLQEHDLIIVAPTADAAVWYYSEWHGIPEVYFNIKDTDFKRAFVIVNLAEGQTVSAVIDARGPSPNRLEVDSAQLLDTFGSLQVYEVPPNE
jgi:hypothetical protein